MPSEHTLSGTGLSASDFGGIPDPGDFDLECDVCGATTSGDEADGWTTTVEHGSWKTEKRCPDCKGGDG